LRMTGRSEPYMRRVQDCVVYERGASSLTATEVGKANTDAVCPFEREALDLNSGKKGAETSYKSIAYARCSHWGGKPIFSTFCSNCFFFYKMYPHSRVNK